MLLLKNQGASAYDSEESISGGLLAPKQDFGLKFRIRAQLLVQGRMNLVCWGRLGLRVCHCGVLSNGLVNVWPRQPLWAKEALMVQAFC